MGKFADKIQQKKEKLIAMQQDSPDLTVPIRPKKNKTEAVQPLSNLMSKVKKKQPPAEELDEDLESTEDDIGSSKFQDFKVGLFSKLDDLLAREKNLTIPLAIIFVIVAILFSRPYFNSQYNLDLTQIYSQILGSQTIKPSFVFNDKGYLTLNMNLQEVMQEVVTPELIAGFIPSLKTYQPMNIVPLLITLIILNVIFIGIPKIPKLKIYYTNLFIVIVLATNALILGANAYYHFSGVESYNKKVQQELTIEKIQNTCYSYYTSTCSDMKSWLVNSMSDCKFYDTEGTYSTVITIPQQYIVDLILKHPGMERVVPTYFQLDQYLYKARGIENDQVIYVFNKKINLLDLE